MSILLHIFHKCYNFSCPHHANDITAVDKQMRDIDFLAIKCSELKLIKQL